MPRTVTSACSTSVTLSRTPNKMAARPPEFEKTEGVLAEFGFTANEIAQLKQAKVV